jgi:DNA-binding transcriptional ArsR family regulator
VLHEGAARHHDVARHAAGGPLHRAKRLCALTDGNLSRHLYVLREAGLVEVWKGFENRRPQTLCRLSTEGRQRFVAYLEQLEQVVRDAMPKAARKSERVPDVPPGFQPA